MLINLFPVYWMFTFSLKSNEEIFGSNVIGLPQNWLSSNYSSALNTGNMARYFLNSIIVATATILITLIVALMGTFALTRLIWKQRKTLNKFFMLGLTIPIHASIVPVYVTLSRLHLLNTYWALIIPYAAFSLSMAILVCTGFMNEIPRELDESACIDGCSVWGIFLRIIVPLMKPAVATVGIYTFLQCWNELMFANIFISKSSLRTLPVGVQALSGQYTTEWGPIGAALVLATFPTLVIYIFLSKKIQESFIAGAIKG
ncbi:MAG: carbohydrate ABC transporter permease [Oscillospiraceae bacterium]|nr:carbohydrate ABC transporter permease [Oscillospiraceae bacterium]